MNSFGWGGDPEQAARLRISKYGWYNFSGSYQHMQNYFDYDLLANPLNPSAGATPYIPILTSPHSYYNRQNLYNFDLVVLPMHRLSFRVGYNRNRITGPSFSSVHQGTDALNNNNWDTTLKRLSLRRRLPRHQENDPELHPAASVLQRRTDRISQHIQFLAAFQRQLRVTFGLPWFNSGSPCSAPLKNGIANPVCNGYINYSLFQHDNTSIPTEQVNLVSSSLKWLDFNGQYQYSHASSSTPLREVFTGLTTRSNTLGYDTGGSKSNSRWNSSSADISATIHLSDQLRMVETFRFRNFSVAGTLLDQEAAYFNAASLGAGSL